MKLKKYKQNMYSNDSKLEETWQLFSINTKTKVQVKVSITWGESQDQTIERFTNECNISNIYRKSRCHRQIPPFTESKNQI